MTPAVVPLLTSAFSVYGVASTFGLRLLPSCAWVVGVALRQLLAQLDPQLFWQIHRAVVVRASAVEAVHRDESGRLRLQLRDRNEQLAVSRLFAHLFRAM
jgi:hypothetical protein